MFFVARATSPSICRKRTKRYEALSSITASLSEVGTVVDQTTLEDLGRIIPRFMRRFFIAFLELVVNGHMQ